jgi:hypothetical protein
MRTMVNCGTQHRRIRRAPHVGAAPGLATRRLYAGRRNALAVQRAFFSAHPTRQVATSGRLEPWLGGAAMVACAACWGLLLAVLGG